MSKLQKWIVVGGLLVLSIVGLILEEQQSKKDREQLDSIIKQLERCQYNWAEADRKYEQTQAPQEEPQRVDPIPRDTGRVTDTVSGKASYYYPGDADGSGTRTASGEKFTGNDMTAAHMTLPFGTKVRVTNPNNNQSVVVTINDRGGFDRLGRVIDLSKAAFQQIAPLSSGVVNVTLEVLS